jgi:hypothetical protein
MHLLAITAMTLLGAAEAPVLHTFDLAALEPADRSDTAARTRFWDTCHFITSMQGIVNRDAPRLYLYAVGGKDASTDRFWLDWMRGDGDWLGDHTLEPLPDLAALARQFKDHVNGLVVYDGSVPATSNVASTIAGVEDLACVRHDPAPGSLFRVLTDELGFEPKVWLIGQDGTPMFTGSGTLPGSDTPSSGSAKCDAYLWAKENYLDTGRCNPGRFGYYLDAFWLTKPAGGSLFNHTLTNQDYFISERGFLFDLSPNDDEAPNDDPGQPVGADFETLKAILRAGYDQLGGKGMIHVGGFVPWDTKYTSVAGGKHEPVPVEWRMVEVLSSYNAWVDADALGMSAVANASLFRQFPLKDRYPQDLPTEEDLTEKGLLNPDGSIPEKTYITFYVGDYDSAAWMYQMMPGIWNDPERGSIPLGWAFNPTLADRFAPGMAYTRATATPNDFFWAGDSGAGYVNPGHVQEPRSISGLPSGMDAWERHCARYYERWGIEATGFVIDGYAPPMSESTLDAYARFSPRGVVAQKVPPLSLHNSVPVIRMNYDLYKPADKAAEILAARVAEEKGRPAFLVFRTILWKPSDHRELMERAKELVPDAEYLDPYSFLLLAKRHAAK